MNVNKLVLGRISNNTYFVTKGKDCIVIDPSMEYSKIISYIRDNDLQVKAILITHAHFDHVYSLYELVNDTGAPVYMHKDDLELYDFSVERLRTEKVNIDYVVNDGDILNIMDEQIEVMHVPGHAEGLVCYIIGDSIFTGDFIFKGSIGRTDLPTSNPEKMEYSLNKFVKLNKDYKLYSGHGDDSTFYEELASNPFLQGRI